MRTMMRGAALAGLALAAQTSATVQTGSANPVQKVLELLDSLTSKVVKEGETEQKQYEEFADWCEDTAKEKQFEIRTGKSKGEDLAATIEKASADIQGYEAKIADFATDVTTHDGDLSSATQIREKEATDFSAENSELANTIDMVGRAISLLKQEMSSRSFVQVTQSQELTQALDAIISASAVRTEDKSKLTALLQGSDEDISDDLSLVQGAPSAKTYENHSGAIISTLEDMLDRAEQMKDDSEKAEQNARHNFEMLSQSLTDESRFAQVEMAAAKKAKSAAEEAKAAAEGELEVVSKDGFEDTKYLSEAKRDCMDRANEWETSQRSRQEELQALTSAKEAIAKMSGGASKRSYALLQYGDSQESQNGDNVAQVAYKIKQMGMQFEDVALTQLSFQMRVASASGQDPFTKVKGLIQSMIERLIADQQKEADHKAFCDKEMSETKAKIEEHSSTIDSLTAKIDKASALVARLKNEISTLQSELAALAKSQSDMNNMRSSEHEEFVSAKKEFEDGLEGMSMALKILRDYYSSQPALLQQPATGAHSKAGGDASGIIGFLEVIESDFARNLAESEAAERSAQEEYDRMTNENEVSTASKKQDVKYKTAAQKRTETLISETNGDRSTEQEELDAVNEYWTRLRPTCVAEPESYAERKKRRSSEISGLKEALQILEGDAIAFLQKRA